MAAKPKKPKAKAAKPKPKPKAAKPKAKAAKPKPKPKAAKPKPKPKAAKPKPAAGGLRRTYTNWLPVEEYTPSTPTDVELVLTGTHLLVEYRPRRVPPGSEDDDDEEDGWESYNDPPSAPRELERHESDHATAEAARAAFDAEVAKLRPRFGIAAPAGEDATLAWVGPGVISVDSEEDLARMFIRTDKLARETTDEDVAPLRGGTESEDAVLADWQLAQDDQHVRARGELANLQRGGAHASPRAMELLAGHADAWTSGLLPIAELGFRGGFVDTLRLAPGAGDPEQDGFADAGTVSAADLQAFLALPIAARVRRIVLGGVGPVSISGNPFIDNDRLLDAICASALPSLRELDLVEAYYETFASLAKLPNLERVVLGQQFVSQGHAIESPSVREIEIRGGTGFGDAMSPENVHCPRLASLVVRSQVRVVEPLLQSALRLKRLTFAPQQQNRGLFSPALSVADAAAYVAALPLTAHLETLVLGGSGDASLGALTSRFPKLAVSVE